MKSIYLSLIFFFSLIAQVSAQPDIRPKAMVMPDREWCLKMGYTDDNNPNEPDFYKALMDKEFATCVTQFSGIMAGRGYQMKDLSSTLESFKTGKAKRMFMTAKDGSQVMENSEDMLARAAVLDLKIRFAIEKKSALGRNQVEFLVKAVDAATDEIIWAEPMSPVVTSAPASAVLNGAVAGKMDSFCNGLQRFFDTANRNGRKCTIEINISDSCPINMSSDITVGDEEAEFADFIYAWMTRNAAEGGVMLSAKEDNMLTAEAFVPLFGESLGARVALTAEAWIKKINPQLKKMGVQMKTSMFGQGKVYCLISGM